MNWETAMHYGICSLIRTWLHQTSYTLKIISHTLYCTLFISKSSNLPPIRTQIRLKNKDNY